VTEQCNYPGPEGPALGYPWKGIFYSKPYKLKVPISGQSRNAGLASWPVLNYGQTGITDRRAQPFLTIAHFKLLQRFFRQSQRTLTPAMRDR